MERRDGTSRQPWMGLPSDEVHVWSEPLDRTVIPPHQLLAILSPGERRKAARFRRPADSRRFIVARGLLRLLLSCYTGREPRARRHLFAA